MKFVGVSSHIKLPFLTPGKNVWHFYKNTSFNSHYYKEGILFFRSSLNGIVYLFVGCLPSISFPVPSNVLVLYVG